MTTEAIVSTKPVVAAGIEKVLITTESGATVWVNKSQFIPNAKSVTYEAHAAGSTWTNAKTGATGTRKSASNEYVGCDGKAQDLTVIKYLISQGITPTFSLS